MSHAIRIEPAPDDGVRDAVLGILVAHNDAAAGLTERRTLALSVRNGDSAIRGGLWGTAAYRWLFVQYLAVAPELRGTGVGSGLLAQAEAWAREAGCIGMWLDTFSFQARGFYERHGFSAFGEIPDYPPGHARFFLAKRF